MLFSKAIEGFKIDKLAEGYAPVTIRGYESSLGTLQEYLSDLDVSKITEENLKSFMHYLHMNYRPERKSGDLTPLASASFHRYWKAIRCFFKWANQEHLGDRPDLCLKMPKYTNKVISPFSEQEVTKMLKACEYKKPVIKENNKPYQCKRPICFAQRDKALLLMLLDTGIRSGECSRLRVSDVNLENGEVYIVPYHVGKTRPRTVYIGKSARRSLWKYLSTRKDSLASDPLFATLKNRLMTQETIRSVCYDLEATSGVMNVHPHRFRHTFAIQYLRNGGDVFTLQRLLGHATLDMVRHYLALADSDSSEAHRKSSPVDRWQL